MTDDAPNLDLVGAWVRVLSLRNRLLRWYDREKRELPWRTSRDPYHVLVSELMLQQTRVDVVLPYFDRWTVRWPTLGALADATEDDVLAAWSGLGYYRRARSLLAIAKSVVSDHGGTLPHDPATLRTLPGIGSYTAAAIASIAFDVPVAVVDGNVERVLIRLLADARDPSAARRRGVEEAARRLVTGFTDDDPAAMIPPEGLRPADWNQAMMELGALVCVPREPRCGECPWGRSCLGFRSGLAAELPRKKEKKPTREVTLHAAVVWRDDHFLLVQRPEGTLLSGMWELPTTDENEPVTALAPRLAELLGHDVEMPAEPTRRVRHTITTRRITLHVHEITLAVVDPAAVAESSPGQVWLRTHDLRDFGVSSMTRKALAGAGGGPVSA